MRGTVLYRASSCYLVPCVHLFIVILFHVFISLLLSCSMCSSLYCYLVPCVHIFIVILFHVFISLLLSCSMCLYLHCYLVPCVHLFIVYVEFFFLLARRCQGRVATEDLWHFISRPQAVERVEVYPGRGC